MIYDCFLFNNELDILEIRLNELYDVVDKFVLVESTVTHVNKPKPLYFKNNKKRFKKFLSKIIHVVVEDTPNVSLAWIINDYQFSQMMRGLKNCKSQDTILFGDLDEIPKAKRVKEWKGKPGQMKIFAQKLCFYYLNCIEISKGEWYGTRMTSYGNIKKLGTTWIAKYTKTDVVISDGGWHFSYMGDAKFIQKKISMQAHQEYNNEKYNTPEKITKAIYSMKDPYGHGYKFKVVGYDFLPSYVQGNSEKFKFLLLNPKTKKKSSILQLLILDLKDAARVLFRRIRQKYSH